MRRGCLLSLFGFCSLCRYSRAAVSHCVRARREFAPAGDSLSLLVQRKEAKKAPQIPSGCHQCVSAACSTAVLSQQLASRLKQLGLSLQPHTSADRGVLHRSICTHRGTCTAAGHPLWFNGAVKYASVQGDMRQQAKVALFEPRGELLRKQCGRAGSSLVRLTPRWKLEVLSLPTFFAPAKKVGRRPGRIPGGLSRSEITQHAKSGTHKEAGQQRPKTRAPLTSPTAA
jgi:hypothetical protein